MLTTNFPELRPGQREVIDRVLAAPTRFVLLSAPTGAGKSVIAAYIAEAVRESGRDWGGARSVFLTSTKQLQAQYRRDFPAMAEIKGMNNYPCQVLRLAGCDEHGCDERGDDYWEPTCDRGPCHDGPRGMRRWARAGCELKNGGCDYYDARREAANGPFVLANYKYFMLAQRDQTAPKQPILGDFALSVCDEAHTAVDQMISAQTTEWSRRAIRLLRAYKIRTDFLDSETLEEARDMVEVSVNKARYIRDRLPPDAPATTAPDGAPSYGRMTPRKKLTRELVKLEALRDAGPGCVWDPEERKLVDTTLTMESCERHLWKGVPKVVLMSATINRQTARTLDIPEEYLTVIEPEATIPSERRPVAIIEDAPWMNTYSWKDTDGKAFRQWIVLIDRILEHAAHVRTIVHTSSYDQAALLAAHSTHRRRIITHGRGQSPDGVRRYLKAPAGAVLASPAVDTGVDFPDDQCRVQIIAKMPWERETRVIKAIEGEHPGYRDCRAVLRMVQQAGRSTRSPQDASATFIIDSNVMKFTRGSRRNLWPEWFYESMEFLPREGVRDMLAITLADIR